MKPNQIFEELSDIAKLLGYRIRRETGNFKSNNCIVKQEKMIILNKFTSIDHQNKTIAQAIKQENYDKIYIKPQIREYIESIENDTELLNIFEHKD